MKPIYRNGDIDIKKFKSDPHKGLLFERFFDYANDWSVSEAEKKSFLTKIVGTCGDRAILKSNAIRQIELVEALGGSSIVLETTWNFVTGMGLPNPVENGLAWHPTLGVPYLAGSGVKGLLRAWVEEWMEFPSEDKKLLALYHLFGSENKDPRERAELRKEASHPLYGNKNDTVAGNLIFFDAIPVSSVEIIMDIMTPHMGKWYENGGKIKNAANEPENIPADWHDPVPVQFLAVKKAKFLFSIVPSQRLKDKAEAKKALDELVKAIEMLGAGAKTAVGYGRMEKDDGTLASLQAEIQKKREEFQRQKELASMTPLEKEIAEIIHTNPDRNMKDYVLLIKKLVWQDPDVKRQVAVIIKLKMLKDKAWTEKSNKKNPERDYDYQKTLAVMEYL